MAGKLVGVSHYEWRDKRVSTENVINRNTPLPIPSPDEQQKIATFLSSIDKKITLISTELNHAQSFKKALLQQMFI
ncbi:MAG: restriction endonuclease subunit S [Candidatus Electrothrix sp. AW3_4]|nr:restriction endonuclease subunit S [Candidatus Electrothrix gigas]